VEVRQELKVKRIIFHYNSSTDQICLQIQAVRKLKNALSLLIFFKKKNQHLQDFS
jgi:hypothetical protein